MKKYSLIVAAAFSSMAVACSDDFLERQPYDQKVIENFYQTPQDALEGLVAAYDVLQADAYGNILLISEIASDNAYGGGGKSDGFGHNYWDWFRSENDLNAEPWRKYYRGIYRTNVIISKLGDVSWSDEEALKNRYEAEARFLRAYYYFDLMRMFENVPLITRPLNAGEYEQPQASPDSVYRQIALDLKFAIENLPSDPYQSIPPTDYGRVTKWAAEGLLARAFLFYTDYYEQSDMVGVVSWQEMIGYVDDLINNSGHDLVPEYKNLWRAASFGDYAGEDNIETVFAIKFTFKGLGDWDAANNGASNGNRWQKFIGIRTQNLYPYAGGWGFATVTPDLYNAYASEDTRRDATIIDIQAEIPDFKTDDQRQYTGYAWKKFAPTLDENGQPTVVNMGGDDQLDAFDDYPAIRFADVLLMGAELHLNGGGRAQEYLDRVRDRAFGDAEHRIPATKENIIEERRLELALEGHRYWDIIRQSMAYASQVLDHDGPGEEFDITFRPETGGFFKIPETQVNLSNGTITQNPGWN